MERLQRRHGSRRTPVTADAAVTAGEIISMDSSWNGRTIRRAGSSWPLHRAMPAGRESDTLQASSRTGREPSLGWSSLTGSETGLQRGTEEPGVGQIALADHFSRVVL